MSAPGTIVDDLQARIDRYVARYGYRPLVLPLTLDEWAWLSEWCAYVRALERGAAPLLNVPMQFHGIRLQLVERVVEGDDGSVAFKR